MRFFLILSTLFLTGCQFLTGPNTSSIESGPEIKAQHVRIDDEVIDKGDPWATLDPVYWTVNIYDGEEAYNDTLAQFSAEQRFVLAVNWYIAEVNNGGHEQFYYNSTGIVWKDALKGFEEIGLKEAAMILEESANRMGGNPSLDRETRWEQMDDYNPNFDDLDEKLFDLEGRIDLERFYRNISNNTGNLFILMAMF
ncbi:MAG: DMP19 family protein [Anaerolineales bacterium]|nr:DMP19 family protein [Anaerolineales bacterium]